MKKTKSKKKSLNKTFMISIIFVIVLFLLFLVFLSFFQTNNFNRESPGERSDLVGSGGDQLGAESESLGESKGDFEIFDKPVISNLSENFKITLKSKNPQFKESAEVSFVYEIENLENQTLVIPVYVESGIEVRKADGSSFRNYSSSERLVIVGEGLEVPPLGRIKREFSIMGNEFELKGSSSTDGFYYSISVYIGKVRSNRVIIRVLK